MKILEICPFSAGICGVWTRVLSESKEFIKLGNEVTVFSSNLVKGTNEIAEKEEKIGKINVIRFESKKNTLSKNVISFNFEGELEDLIKNDKIDLVITHLLHPHSFRALKICNKNKIPCYLVTHAPFNINRKFPLNLVTNLYSQIKVKPQLNKFTGIIAITQWEYPFLKKLGVKESKITYIPNGIPEEFFIKKLQNSKKPEVLFLGRIAPVKNLETLLEVAKILPEINFSIVGSAEQEYLEKLEHIIKLDNISNVEIKKPIIDLNKKIDLFDSYNVFVLPSAREAMPTVLLEAMSRGLLIISSKSDGGKEIVQNEKNGFLFEISNYNELAKLIKENINGNKKLQEQAIKDSKQYSWSKLIKQYMGLFKK